jgi:hypothetical protein
MAVSFIQPTFAAGEIAPSLYARVDLAKYHAAAKLLRNFFVLPHGGVSNRAGTQFVGRCLDSSHPVHLIPFQFNILQAYALEFGHQYMRVIMNGGYVLEPGVAITGITNANPGVITAAGHGCSNGDRVYLAGTGTLLDSTPGRQYLVANATTNTFTLTDLDGNVINTTNYGVYGGSGATVARVFTLATPYAGSDAQALKWTQSADTLTLCHPNYPPMDLTRTQHWVWNLTQISFAPSISAPSGVTFSADAGESPAPVFNYSYVVTAFSDTPPDESFPSVAAGGKGTQLNSNTGAYNTISWAKVTGATGYRVYKANPTVLEAIPAGAMYGYIGTATGESFVDTEIAPDFSQSPPQGTNPFAAGVIATVSVTNGGSGYTSNTTLYVSDVSGTGAVLAPTISNGVPSGFSVNAGGTGYAGASGLSVTGGTGSGLKVNITASGGAITAATINWGSPGSGYAVNDVLTVAQSGASGGTIKVTGVNNGVITSVNITSGGQNYQEPVVGVGNTGSGASGYISTNEFNVITATITATGQDYFGNVAVSVASGTGCTFTPVIVAGQIMQVKVTEGQNVSGYVDGESLVFTQTTGTGATFAVSVVPSGNYPSCAAYFQQRKVFAGSLTNPQTIWMTKPADFKNMDISNPSQANDAIVATIVANQVNAIKWLVPMNNLLVMTSGGAWALMGGYITNPVAVTPSNIVVVPQSYNGCADLPPIVVNYDVLYAQAQGSIVRDLAYNFYAQVYTGTDMSILSNHLFFGHNLTRWCYAEQPWYQIWAVRDDGVLLSFTYLKEQDVYAWAHSDSPGSSGTDQFLSCASIVEQQVSGINASSVYFVVQRTIPGVNGGQPVKYIERMTSRNFLTNGVSDVTKAWFVDCGLQYAGSPATVISGLDHLNGATVSILADGSVQPQQVVSGGSIMLQYPASIVTVGLAYVAQFQSLCMTPEGVALQTQSFRKKISAVMVRVTDTRGLKVGPSFEDLSEMKERSASVYMGASIPLFTGDERIQIDNRYLVDDDVCIRQDQPLPCTILGVIPDVNIGDTPG